MKNTHKIVMICLALFLGANAQAFRVNLDADNNATSISNLDIGGTFYDVFFEESAAGTAVLCPGNGGSTYPCDLYAANPATDPGDQAGATAAAAQIALALNDDTSIGGLGNPVAVSVGPTGDGGLEVLVPWHFDAGNACNGGVGGATGTCAQQAIPPFGAGSWGVLGIGLQEIAYFSSDDPPLLVNYARFAPAAPVVPIPPAAWLFGSALGMLGWIRRRARQAASSNDAKASHMA